MKKLFIILLSALSLAAVAQKKVAVYVTGEQSGINKVLGDQLVAAFAKSNKYVAVERTNDFLAEISKEQNYQLSGAVSDNEISRLGQQFGVNYVCVADISEAFGEKYISARLIDVVTAEIVNTHNASGAMSSMSDCINMATQIATNLTKGTFAEQREDAIVQADIAKKQREAFLRKLKEEGYVDLGLPSGTWWKRYDEADLYTHEMAVETFGNKLPSEKQYKELLSMCKWSSNGQLYTVVGPNGNYIQFKIAGYRRGYNSELENARDRGYFWTSNRDERYTAFEKYHCLYVGLNTKYYMESFDHYYLLSVKLVQKVEKK